MVPLPLTKQRVYVISLALEIISGYIELDPETQARNIDAWTPVMVEVLHCFYSLDKETVRVALICFYGL
jgi:brefeldin A-inhibited guanine nucleotide-exchange protein